MMSNEIERLTMLLRGLESSLGIEAIRTRLEETLDRIEQVLIENDQQASSAEDPPLVYWQNLAEARRILLQVIKLTF